MWWRIWRRCANRKAEPGCTTTIPRDASSCGLAGGAAALGAVPVADAAAGRGDAGDAGGRDPQGRRRRPRCSTGKVKLDMPPLVENGNTVPMTVTVDSPMTAADYVKASTSSTRRTRSRTSAISISGRAPAARRCRPASGSPTRRRSSPSPSCRDGSFWSDQRRRDRHARRLPRGGDLMARALINVPPRAPSAATSSRSRR